MMGLVPISLVRESKTRTGSSRGGSITIVDELSRCLENMLEMNVGDSLSTDRYDHHQTLQAALDSIVEGMKSKFSEQKVAATFASLRPANLRL